MSNEMNIIIKPKYNDFIKIIDNFDAIIENKKEIENKPVEINENTPKNKSSSDTHNQNTSDKEDSSVKEDASIKESASIKEDASIKEESSVKNNENSKSNISIYKESEKNNLTLEKIDNSNDEIILSDNESKKIFEKLYSLLNIKKNLLKQENLSSIKSSYKKNSSIRTLNKDKENDTDDTNKSNSIKFVKRTVNFENTTNTKSKSRKSKKIKKENLNEEEQKEKLEQLYDKKINEENTKSSEKKSKKYKKDELKKICKDFEEKCIMDSVRNFNVKEDMFYLDFIALAKNITSFNSSIPDIYDCSILYRNYKDNKVVSNPDKKIGWMEITKSGEKFINSKNKYLSACHRIFDKTDKFRKTIDGTRVRALKLTFLVYKTNIKVDIYALIKSNY